VGNSVHAVSERPSPDPATSRREVAARRREVAAAGHRGEGDVALAHLLDPDARVRVVALGAAERCGVLTAEALAGALGDPDPKVRRRALELAARRSDVSIVAVLADPDPAVVEVAAWACGERDPAEPGAVVALSAIATAADDALCREAAVAALGAIGDPAGLPAILRGCRDRPPVRRRAVLALAPFGGPEVLAALEAARHDRDWQVRQAAEDLLEIVSGERP
jgi:HEAT repeat protein